MEQRTQQIFSNGEENLAIAQLLATQDATIASAARRWSTISAFYAAVQYVNAWLWERFLLEPRDHTERRTFIMTMEDLKPVAGAYIRLQDRGYDARYRVGFRISSSDLNDLLEQELQSVRSAILQLLNDQA